jgi:hypothetical protein
MDFEHSQFKWVCTTAVHESNQYFDSEDLFVSHMQQEHVGAFRDSQLPALAKSTLMRTPATHGLDSCSLCGAKDDQNGPMSKDELYHHVAEHLKSLALLSYMDINDEDGDEGESLIDSSTIGDRQNSDAELDKLNKHPLPIFEDIARPNDNFLSSANANEEYYNKEWYDWLLSHGLPPSREEEWHLVDINGKVLSLWTDTFDETISRFGGEEITT